MKPHRINALVLAFLAQASLATDSLRRLPAVTDSSAPVAIELLAYPECDPCPSEAAFGEAPPNDLGFEVGAQFDKGVYVRSSDMEERPFSLYVGGRLQLRHTGFVRDDRSWTDAAGVTREIRNRNLFETERARINFSGEILDPDLSYLFILDGDADGISNVDMLAYIVTYEFAPQFKVRLGRWKAASDREWLLSSRFFRMVDRAMATEYFRVGFTDGVWLLGDLGESFHYETSLTNGMRTAAIIPNSLDDNLSFALSAYSDPLGPFGQGEADYACHDNPVVRVGGSFAFDKSDDRSEAGVPLGDDGFLRLSDGTRLAEVGALAPGVRLLSDRVIKGSIDAAIKWRGWSLSGEYFVRSIQDLKADGPIPVTKIDDHGFRADMGVFIVPKRLDVNARMSHVSGTRGDAYEYSVGGNWYWGSGRHNDVLDDRVNKFSFDVTELKGAPVNSTPANIVAGDDGVLFRTQVQIGY